MEVRIVTSWAQFTLSETLARRQRNIVLRKKGKEMKTFEAEIIERLQKCPDCPDGDFDKLGDYDRGYINGLSEALYISREIKRNAES